MNRTNGSLSNIGILKGVQVLVVDNDHSSGEMYTCLLNRFGAIVKTTSSVKEALEILGWLIPDILVCEIRFLGESVYTLTKRLSDMEADTGNHIPIIATPTWVNSLDKVLEAEFDGYLLKPVALDKLVSTIRNLMQSGRNHSSAYRLGLKSSENVERNILVAMP